MEGHRFRLVLAQGSVGSRPSLEPLRVSACQGLSCARRGAVPSVWGLMGAPGFMCTVPDSTLGWACAHLPRLQTQPGSWSFLYPETFLRPSTCGASRAPGPCLLGADPQA